MRASILKVIRVITARNHQVTAKLLYGDSSHFEIHLGSVLGEGVCRACTESPRQVG